MDFENNNIAEEMLGLEEFLDRYTNPINKQMYIELFSIFINKEEMNIFDSISEMISNEEQLESGDITTVLHGLIKRSAIAVLKNAYGIILTEELEIRLLDLYNALLKLNFLINIDKDRADIYINIIDDRTDDLEAYQMILEDLGVEMDFVYNYIEDVEYDFLDTYVKILKGEIDKQDSEDDELEDRLKLNTIINCIKNTILDNKSELLNMSIARNSYLKESDLLEIFNSDTLFKDNLPFELLSAYKLTASQLSVADFFKEYTENILFTDLAEQERYYTLFKDLEAKYKIELAKRMNDE